MKRIELEQTDTGLWDVIVDGTKVGTATYSHTHILPVGDEHNEFKITFALVGRYWLGGKSHSQIVYIPQIPKDEVRRIQVPDEAALRKALLELIKKHA